MFMCVTLTQGYRMNSCCHLQNVVWKQYYAESRLRIVLRFVLLQRSLQRIAI